MHHILPKHSGGTDDPSNLVKLTPKEHADAHLKLYEQYGKKEDLWAYKMLAKKGDVDISGVNHMYYGKKRPDISKKYKGKGNPFYGKTHTEESNQKRKAWNLARWGNADNEFKEKIAESARQMGLKNKGRKHSPEVNAKKHPKLTCVTCGKTMNKANFVRYGHKESSSFSP